jgi:hypothetical protein
MTNRGKQSRNSLQLAGDLFVLGEFLAVVRSDRVQLLSMWLKQPDHCLADCKCGLAFDLLNQYEARLALNDAHNGLTMILTNDGINFPVTDATACLDDVGRLLRRPQFRDNSLLMVDSLRSSTSAISY